MNWAKYRINSTWLSVVFLISLAVITHLLWFNPFSTITSSDWGHYQQNALNELYQTAGTWNTYNNFGVINIQLPFYLFMTAWSLLGNLGLNYDLATKITFFIPIAILNFLAPYILFRYIFKDNIVSVLGAIFYGSTTYGIANDPPIQLVYALAPLIFYFFIKAIDTKTIKNWIYFSLLYSLGITYEIRIMYLVSFILIVYLAIFKLRSLPYLLKISTVIIPLIILLNLYWILATLKGSTGAISAVANRGLFGNNLFDLTHSLTISNWYWTGGTPNNNFIKQQVPYILWLIPIFLAFSLTWIKKNKYKSWVIFFLTISLIGIFLTKQVASPFGFVYQWLYNNFPGFNLFREASKFFILTSFGYAGLLITVCIYYKNKNKTFFNFLITFLLIISLINFIPLVDGKFGGLFVNRHIPDSYVSLNNFLSNKNGYFKTYSVPATSRWLYYSQSKPSVSAINATQNAYKNFSGPANQISTQNQIIESSITQPFLNSYSNQLFNVANIKYIIVPLRDSKNNDDFFQFYGDDRNFYINILEGIPWLKRLNLGNNQNVVFENSSYKPYIFSNNIVSNIDNFSNINDKYMFQNQALNDNAFYFIANNSQNLSFPTRKITDIFENLTAKDLKGNYIGLTNTLSSDTTNVLYANLDSKQYSYQITSNKINFFNEIDNQLSINGSVLGASTQNHMISSTNIIPKNNYEYSIGNILYPLANSTQDHQTYLQYTNKNINLYSFSPLSNLIPNSNFKNGLWQNKVYDCNDYDNNAVINIKLSKDPAKGPSKVLELDSYDHTACTTANTVQVIPGQQYSLSYNYYLIGAQKAGYKINFLGTHSSSIENYQISRTQKWIPLNNVFTVPKNVHFINIQLLGFPDETGFQEGQTYYSSISLFPLQQFGSLNNSESSIYTPINLTGKVFSTNITSNGTFQNIIPNPKLTEGLWQKTVGDCNAYDKNPILKMILNTKIKSTGAASLQLEATRHNACTGPTSISVQPAKTYLFSFDYQSPTQSQASYYIGFNDPNGSVLSKNISIEDQKWHTYETTFTVPTGANSVTLIFYSQGDQYGRLESINRYDNFSLIELPQISNRYYLVSTPKNNLVAPKNTALLSSSPTVKIIRISKAKTPFYLNMSESFDSNWRLEILNNKVTGLNNWLVSTKPNAIPASDHYDLDDFANGWYVDINQLCSVEKLCQKNSDGSYNLNMEIEFTPQRYFYLGLLISGATLISCIGYLTYYFKFKRGQDVYSTKYVLRK